MDSTDNAPPTPSAMPLAGHSTPGPLSFSSLPQFGSTPAGRQPGEDGVVLQATKKTVRCAADPTKSSKVIQKFLAPGGLDEDKLCDTLQAMAPTNVKMVNQTSLLHIESNPDRLGLLSPILGQRSQQQNGQITLHSVLIK